MPTRERRAKMLGVSIDQLPDGRGRHSHHARADRQHRWNDGLALHTEGYIKVRVGVMHPLADPNGYAYLHHLVWVAAGDSLEGRVLHHMNGVKTDNRWENLKGVSRSDHNREHPLERNNLGQFVGKKAAGAVLDGREWREMPQVAAGGS